MNIANNECVSSSVFLYIYTSTQETTLEEKKKEQTDYLYKLIHIPPQGLIIKTGIS